MTAHDKYGLFINDEWIKPDGPTITVTSPVTGKSICTVPAATTAHTDAAIAAAIRALPQLSSLSGWERADKLHLAADDMEARIAEAAHMISLETGKPIAQATREWVLSYEQFRWYAEEARRICGRIVPSRVPGGQFEITSEPVGIVGAFTAWNFPASLPARKLAPALAAGCPVILRPSSQTPGVAMVMVDCLRKADFPAGSVQLVIGKTADTYDPIMASEAVRKVSLTGSTRIGQQMIRDAAYTMKKVSMELGGNAPLIIFDDANLEAALDAAVATKFGNCGQVCVTADRIYVHEGLHDAFVSGFVARANAMVLGDGLDPAVQMGPLINAGRLDEIKSIVNDAIASGATCVAGGAVPDGLGEGYFYQPTVLTQVTDEMRVMTGENFGPVAAIATFKTEDEVMTRANASQMGLSAYAFTADPARARRVAKGLKAGMVGINSFSLAAAEAPFGGTKFSGMGREGGVEGIADYLETKLTQLVF